MFAFGDEKQERSYDIGQYGVIAKDKDDGMILNNIIKQLTSSFDPGAYDDIDMGFGTDAKNNSVAYEYLKEYYNNFDFIYTSVDENVTIECKTCYIPFEGRIDKNSFQIILSETRPKNLIIVNASSKKVERIVNYVKENRLNIKVSHVKNKRSLETQGEIESNFALQSIPHESPRITLESSLTNLSSNLHHGTVHHSNSDRYIVNRIYGRLRCVEDFKTLKDTNTSKSPASALHKHHQVRIS